jgi:glucose-6-phosphate 1-dehydrogenase
MQPDEAAATRAARKGDPCTIVIFGASGDLTKRKLIPALYNLAHEGLLPDELAVVGYARRDIGTDNFRTKMREATAEYTGGSLDDKVWTWLESRLHYVRGDLDTREDYQGLASKLEELETQHKTRGNALFYLATAPDHFGPVVQHLEECGLTAETKGGDRAEASARWRRVVVEKPFGHDLATAKVLNQVLRRALDEKQIYRIDHYLGKETVQNLLVFRFSNGIFEPIWNRRYVDHVQITVAETLGVEGRGGYYEHSGALRDMVPNHIFQLISLVAMEPPISFDADAVRDEQTKALRAVSPMAPEQVLQNTVRGQYGAGKVDSRNLPAYRSEANVNPRSNTETFVAMKLEIDNWRWKGVPFYLRVGKALPKRVTEIMVQFRRPPFSLFRDTPVEELQPNQLIINVQPDEGITLNFAGYERLLYDALLGDQTLFQRADMVEWGWSVVSPVLDVWQALPARDYPNYAAGTWGPVAAKELMARDGRAWRK